MSKFIFGTFWFFFVLMFVSGIFFFIFTALPAIFYTYGIDLGVQANQNLVDLGVSSNQSQNNILAIANSYNSLYKFGDYAFLLILISLFAQSLISSSQASRSGIFSFFGFMTIGNIILIFILSYAVHIRDWFLNEIVYNILTISIETRFFDFFFSYSYYIAMIWYIIILFVNIIDFKRVASNMPFLSKDNRRFEE